MSDAFVQEISDRYIELYESIIGEKFDRIDVSQVLSRVEKNILNWLNAKQAGLTSIPHTN